MARRRNPPAPGQLRCFQKQSEPEGHELAKPFFDGAIQLPQGGVMHTLAEEFHGAVAYALHGFMAPAFWLTAAGFVLATFMYLLRPELAVRARRAFALPVRVLEAKYGFDKVWIIGFAGGSLALGRLSRWFDSTVIDEQGVNGVARDVRDVAGVVRRLQTGHLYSYAFAMIVGLILLLAWLLRAGVHA